MFRWIKLLRVLVDISHGDVPVGLKKFAATGQTKHQSHGESGTELMVDVAMLLRMKYLPDYVETGPESVMIIICKRPGYVEPGPEPGQMRTTLD